MTRTREEAERGARGFQFGGARHRQHVRERFTDPAVSERDFFEQRLPGFEARFEASPFFKLEQERLEREDISKRRPLLRTRGRGRTIVTRGRA